MPDFRSKTLLIVYSYHHNNTEKVARTFAGVLEAAIMRPEQVDPETLKDYDLIGFGSGIDSARHYKQLLDLVDRLPPAGTGKAFIFSTCGVPACLARGEQFEKLAEKNHSTLRQKLHNKGYAIVDEFSCPGFNTNSFLKLFGGLNKGRPDAEDLQHAAAFAAGLLRKTGGSQL